jgi:hypothetical protein
VNHRRETCRLKMMGNNHHREAKISQVSDSGIECLPFFLR